MPLSALARRAQGFGNECLGQAQESYRQFAGEFGGQGALRFQDHAVYLSERIAGEDSHKLQ